MRVTPRDDARVSDGPVSDGPVSDGPVVVVDRQSGVGAFLLGLGLGAAAALLLAPRSGEDTRRQLSRRATDAGDSARRRAQGLVEAGRVAAAQARADLERRIAETKAAYQAGAAGARQSGAQQTASRAGVVPRGYESFDGDGHEG